MGSDTDGMLYKSATFNRWNDERNVNVNRNDNDWNDNWWVAGVRNPLHGSSCHVHVTGLTRLRPGELLFSSFFSPFDI